MELRHLRYFQAVAEDCNITRAAERLHIAQPPLSRQIRQLEDELGVALFERSRRGLRLTEAGRFFLEHSAQLTARLGALVEDTRRIGQSGRRWFGVGLVPSTLYGFIPELIRELRASRETMEVGLAELTTLQQVEALKAGRIDIGFGRIVIRDDAICQRVVMTESLSVALSPANPLSGRERLRVEDVAGEPFILYPARPRPSYADHITGLFRGAGYELDVVHEANELQTALGLVAAGMGVTLVPASAQRLRRDDVVHVPLAAPGFVSPVIMSHRADDESPFLKSTIEAALALAARGDGPGAG
ncbi:LysR family transcriptional regulator [Verticiella sediminum]|uniref:LysR family transcriptional regulator n=1 Tax=Verticiella sediminum TaxID=1247510 RepID=A0A556AFH5_9BURK|nr:LysR family transcriptional regulator [Verticiella sediminum]TSH91613.1 LysR family transcriptional regulator [Verticiella sediminum]